MQIVIGSLFISVLSTSAEGDFSISLPSISFGTIVERAVPLRKAGPVLVPGRPWRCAPMRGGLIVMDVMASIVVTVSPLLFIILWVVWLDNWDSKFDLSESDSSFQLLALETSELKLTFSRPTKFLRASAQEGRRALRDD